MSNNKRTGKFYRRNEEEVMKALGLKPTKNSGSGWIEKEDGQNDFIICQLKSTDAQSIKINQKDIRILEVNAATVHKLPVFAIQFLNTGEVWLMAKPDDFTEVAKYIETGKCEVKNTFVDIGSPEDGWIESEQKEIRKIKSSKSAREQFFKERDEKYNKVKKAR